MEAAIPFTIDATRACYVRMYGSAHMYTRVYVRAANYVSRTPIAQSHVMRRVKKCPLTPPPPPLPPSYLSDLSARR